ncbi:hypothetical protein LCGC14_0418120 [marine sediment metagenome]|uniref:Uncharacterized protein n=1 Tax=marine sediment metagenome TaxID=412755 RepID=A0A0F9VDU1_9ZZZZ
MARTVTIVEQEEARETAFRIYTPQPARDEVKTISQMEAQLANLEKRKAQIQIRIDDLEEVKVEAIAAEAARDG